MKKPKWLRWESGDTESNDLKKVRRQTDQRLKQQDAQKEQRDEAEKKNQSSSVSSARHCPGAAGPSTIAPALPAMAGCYWDGQQHGIARRRSDFLLTRLGMLSLPPTARAKEDVSRAARAL